MLVAVLVVLLAVFGFVRIAEELGEGELAKLDEWLLELLRVPGEPHHPVGPPWLMEAAQDITVLGGRTMLLAVTLFATGYLALERKYGAMWLVAAAAGGGRSATPSPGSRPRRRRSAGPCRRGAAAGSGTSPTRRPP